jgi:ATP-dependent exoDNAse (exonuclease V) alpha subunit
MITQNRNKQLSVVNGRQAHVVQMEGNTVLLKLANNNIVQLYPVSFPNDVGTIKTVVPLMPAYAITIPKAQRQTLKQSIVWLDCPVLPPGGAYLALSRCKKLDNIRFMTPIMSSQVTPVSLS